LAEKNLKLLNYNTSYKKALFSAFFYASILCVCGPAPGTTSPGITSADHCDSLQFDEVATVKYVHDGDTLHLTDRRKIRLIGIDTPELARKGKPAQPYAFEAKKSLQELIFANHNKIGLVFGEDKLDRYGRTLAHLFLLDGANIQAELISRGLAIAYTTPPNTRYSKCYALVENKSRELQLGFWSHDKYKTLQSDMFTADTKGFRIIRGIVKTINLKSKSIWINLENSIKVQIREKDRHYFDPGRLSCLKGKPVQIRGWIHPRKNGFYMSLRHPSALSFPDLTEC